MAVLDTTVLIDLAGRGGRRHMAAAERMVASVVEDGGVIATTRLNVAELLVGVFRSLDPNAERQRVAKILAGLVVLELDEAAGEVFGATVAYLQRIGRPTGDMDVLIASIALSNGPSS